MKTKILNIAIAALVSLLTTFVVVQKNNNVLGARTSTVYNLLTEDSSNSIFSGNVWVTDNKTIGAGNTTTTPDIKMYSDGTKGWISSPGTLQLKAGTNNSYIDLGDGTNNAQVRYNAYSYIYNYFARAGTITNSFVADTVHDHFAFGSYGVESGHNWIFTNYLTTVVDHDHGTQTNPTVWIHSVTSPNVSNNQFLGLTHNQTDAVLVTGANVGAGTGTTTIANGLSIKPQGTEWFRFDAGFVTNKGGLKTKGTTITTSTSPYTILVSDFTLNVNTTGGIVTTTLPAIAAANDGQVYEIVDAYYNAGTNNIVVARTGTDKIDNVSGNFTINVSGDVMKIRANNTTKNWQILNP